MTVGRSTGNHPCDDSQLTSQCRQAGCRRTSSNGAGKPMSQNASSQALSGSLTHLLHRACQVADGVFNEEAGATGLTTRQFAVLVAVAENKDISQTGLVHATGIDRSTVAEIVKRLLKRNLIKRRRTRLDARTYAVRLTEEGEALLSSVAPAARRAEARLASVLNGHDGPVLNEALAHLVAAFPQPK
ncbi:MAG: MarR family winged helix-turn-helix transcriptional regulator [Hyphomicrobiaceae bacterium]|nr:MarR family winged helix-turn-helix transcriptional regulator [Hyphomicrobiaceae bacterium]